MELNLGLKIVGVFGLADVVTVSETDYLNRYLGFEP